MTKEEYRREYYKKNAEAIKTKSRAWSVANRERKSETDRKYRLANLERLSKAKRAYQKRTMRQHVKRANAWRAANLEKQRQVEQTYRDKNRAACNERIRAWKKKNKPLLVIHALVRSKRTRQATPKWVDMKAVRALYEKAASMRRGGLDVHVDHVVPLSNRLVCGLHWEGNLQIVAATENLKKCNYRWPDMP